MFGFLKPAPDAEQKISEEKVPRLYKMWQTRVLISTAFVYIGLMFVGLVTAFGGPTGAALNPARDLGPRIVYSFLPQSVVGENKDAKWWYAWVPVVATIVGAVIAATVFKLMFK